MAASTKKRKKRMKRQLQKRFKQTSGKALVTPLVVTPESPKELYLKALDKAYNGAVTPLSTYLNERATMLFFCEKCGTEFFNRAGYMVGKDSQRHVCTLPYGDFYGNRLSHVSSKHHKKKKKDSVNVGDRLYQMILEDYTYQEISKELGLNPALIKNHFKEEGLI